MKGNKKSKDIVSKAIKQLKNEQIPPGPPQELTDATVTRLNESAGRSQDEGQTKVIERIKILKTFTKIAAVVALLVGAGYATGRLSAPRPPGMDEIQAALEPAIRDKLLVELKQYLQLGLANYYVQLKDDIGQQYRRDLNEFAVQTLAASNSVTHHLLEELIESINAAQTQDRQWVTTALEQIELNRLRDTSQLSNALVNFAAQTEDELTRTRQDMARFLVNTKPNNQIPDLSKNSNLSNERSEK